MDTSFICHAYGLIGYICTKTEYKGKTIFHYLEKNPQKIRCEECKNHRLVHNGYRIRRFTSVPIGGKRIILIVKVHRLKCKSCGKDKYEDVPFSSGNHHYTNRLSRFVICLLKMMTIKDAASFVGLSWDTVKDIHKTYLSNKYQSVSIKDVEHIGIDEFATSKGHVYMTTVVDLITGAIIYVHRGKDTAVLNMPFFKHVRYSTSSRTRKVARMYLPLFHLSTNSFRGNTR